MTSNNEKIMEILEKEKDFISTTELANKTNIDIKNITRYLKPLELEGKIIRKTIQNGKIRIVNIRIVDKKDIKPLRVVNSIIEKQPQEEIIIPERKILDLNSFNEIEKLSIDELRAIYVVACKKRPKHDSKQDKRFLVNEIINILEVSKE